MNIIILLRNNSRKVGIPEKTLPDIQTTEYVLNWLQSRHFHQMNEQNNTSLNEPFFLAAGFHKPHIPLKFPKEYLSKYKINHNHS